MPGGSLSQLQSVHRIRFATTEEKAAIRAREDVPVIERYQDLATHIHRTAIAPRGSSYLWGCVCGAAGIVPDSRVEAADVAARTHVLNAAQVLYKKLEGTNTTAQGDNPT